MAALVAMSILREVIGHRKLYKRLKDYAKLTAAAPRPMVLGFLLDARTSEVDALLPALGVVLALVKESSEAPAQNPNFNITSILLKYSEVETEIKNAYRNKRYPRYHVHTHR